MMMMIMSVSGIAFVLAPPKWYFHYGGHTLYDAACPPAESGWSIIEWMKRAHYEAALWNTGQQQQHEAT